MVLHLVIFTLLVTSLVFTIIELGLSGHIVSDLSSRFFSNANYNYLLFCSIWTMLITAFLLIWPFVNRSQSPIAKTHSEKWLSPLTLVLNLVTMVFWLGAFATLANMYDGSSVAGTAGAQEAFAVMLWLLFLVLFIVNLLTALGVYKVDRAGHSRIFRKARFDGVRNTTETSEVA